MKKLSKNSHKRIFINCDIQISTNCKKNYSLEYRDWLINKQRNNGKCICLYCSRQLKYSGRINPNCKYLSLDDFYFDILDSREKSYFLGWIAGDGHIKKEVNSISIFIKNLDIEILNYFNSLICKENLVKKIKKDNGEFVELTINSKKCKDIICQYLEINGGKKSHIVKFPKIIQNNKELCKGFIQGIFEADGCFKDVTKKYVYPEASIASSSIEMLKSIQKISSIGKINIKNKNISFYGKDCLKFINFIYDNHTFKLNRKYERAKNIIKYFEK